MNDEISSPVSGRAGKNRGQTDSGVRGIPRDGDRDVGAPSKAAWTPSRVEERLRKAVALRTAFTEERLADEIASRQDPEGIGTIRGIGVGRACAGRDDVVADAAEALSWLQWLDPDDAGIVVTRLDGAPWKAICWRHGISRPTADRRWRYAMLLIAWRLNGHAATDRTPSLRSLLRLRRVT